MSSFNTKCQAECATTQICLDIGDGSGAPTSVPAVKMVTAEHRRDRQRPWLGISHSDLYAVWESDQDVRSSGRQDTPVRRPGTEHSGQVVGGLVLLLGTSGLQQRGRRLSTTEHRGVEARLGASPASVRGHRIDRHLSAVSALSLGYTGLSLCH